MSMHPLFEFLLKANGLLSCFYLVYKVLLVKDTFFQFSRYYLVFGMLLSVTLPFVTFTKIEYIEVKQVFIPKTTVIAKEFIPMESAAALEASTINWEVLVMAAYIGIVLFLVLKLIIGFGKLFSVIQQSALVKKQRKTYLQSHLIQSPFSFFNYIVYNPELINQDELEVIILHEEAHSNQNHSVDTLLAQLITIFFWFNPVVWWYQKSIVQNLEFLADKEAIARVKDRICYQKAMLKFNVKPTNFVCSNSFNQSLIKKRIVMLNKKQSSKTSLWKFGVILPILIIFMLLFQVKLVAQEVKVKAKATNKVSIEEKSLKKQDQKVIVKEADWEKVDSILKLKVEINDKIQKKQSIFESKKPLILLDGVEITSSELEKIPSESIVTMNVIKGQQAQINYGAKAVDGVIVITTNKMIKEDPKVLIKGKGIIHLENGDDALIFDSNKLKVPGHPTILLDNASTTEFYINDSKREASEIGKLLPENIKAIDIKKDKDGNSKVYITTK